MPLHMAFDTEEGLNMRGGAKKYISSIAKLEGGFLEAVLPVRTFATLTTIMQFSEARFEDCFTRWVQGLQAHNRVTIGWIRALECVPQRHSHVGLIAASPLDCRHAETLWQVIVSPRNDKAAEVKPYVCGIGGMSYVLKELGITEAAQFSPNLTGFASLGATRFYGRNRTERRQIRRIKEQQKLSSRSGEQELHEFEKCHDANDCVGGNCKLSESQSKFN